MNPEKIFEQKVETQKALSLNKQLQSQSSIQLPLLEDYARLNILSRTTKGLFPDVIPDQQTLKDLLQNFEKEQGAVPLASPSPLLKMNKATMKIPNFIEYEPEFEMSINDDTWRQRKKALTYALLTHRGRGLGVAEEMAKMGHSLLETAESLAEEGLDGEESSPTYQVLNRYLSASVSKSSTLPAFSF